MHEEEELRKLIRISPINRQSLQKFIKIDESHRKIIIDNFINNFQNSEFYLLEEKEVPDEIDKNLRDI